MFDFSIETLWSVVRWAPLLLVGWLTGKIVDHYSSRPSASPPKTREAENGPVGLPFIGHAIALGRLGVPYIQKCRQQFGDVFTLSLVGQKMTFLHDPALIDLFFKAPDSDISFRPAVEQFTERVFGLPSKEFFPKHSDVLASMRHLLVPQELKAHGVKLAAGVMARLPSLMPHGKKVDLFAAVRGLVFQSAVDTLFGDKLLQGVGPQKGDFSAEFEEAFFDFESGFELAASPVPHMFQPGFINSRSKLTAWLAAAHKAGQLEDTVAGQIFERSGLQTELAANMYLSILWASQANTMPACFWTLAFLMLPRNGEHLATVRKEMEPLEEATAAKDVFEAAYKLATDKTSAVSCCVAEAIRIKVQSIDVRMAARDLEVETSTGKKVFLPEGRVLAICPYESHMDKRLYDKPEDFNPQRSPVSLGENSAVLKSVAGLAYGGGPYRCPGRFFAEMELSLVVLLILNHVGDMQLLKPGTAPDVGVGEAPSEAQVFPSDESLLNAVAPGIVRLFGQDVATWGLGFFSKSDKVEEESDSPDDWLPKSDLCKLVGVKVPTGLCCVSIGQK